MTREWTPSKPSQSKLIVHITVTQVAFKEKELHHAACMTHRSQLCLIKHKNEHLFVFELHIWACIALTSTLFTIDATSESEANLKD